MNLQQRPIVVDSKVCVSDDRTVATQNITKTDTCNHNTDKVLQKTKYLIKDENPKEIQQRENTTEECSQHTEETVIPDKLNKTNETHFQTNGSKTNKSHNHKLSLSHSSSEDSDTISKHIVNTTGTKEVENDDWEKMYDESGEFLDTKIEQLTSSVNQMKIDQPTENTNNLNEKAPISSKCMFKEEEFSHILEVSNFPVEFRTQDLLMIFSQYRESGFDIKWVDDTHALVVFSSSRIAAEVRIRGHPFVKLKPLTEASSESRLKAKKCALHLQPYRARPETCVALARRLVTGALGLRLKTAAIERENEKRILNQARERKLQASKQQMDAWDS